MPLILPNTVANLTPADGDKLDQNFDTIVDWANQDAISADGSTAMRAPLLLPGPPTQQNQAATKGYVDSAAPLGAMFMFAGDVEPQFWMFCRGQAISRATYAGLFNVIGTRFGAGDNTTTFNLPDMRGQYPFGFNQGGAYGQVGVGQRFGNKDAAAILPPHNHDLMNHQHYVSANTSDVSNYHSHGTTTDGGFIASTSSGYTVMIPGGGVVGVVAPARTSDDGGHVHGFSAWSGGPNNNATGHTASGDGTNANLPPSVSFNFLMKVQ